MAERLRGKKIGILLESDFYEHEIFYYQYHIPFECRESFEEMSDAELRSYAAIIVPSAMVSDRLRYTEDVNKLPPACEFMKRAFAEPSIVTGIICHGMWLVS